MSEATDNSRQRQDHLKKLILELHKGADAENVRGQIARLIGQVPYGDVVAVEQELISEGLPTEEVLRLCDIHSAALRGQIDLSGMKAVPEGHPVHTFSEENRALEAVIAQIEAAFSELRALSASGNPAPLLTKLLALFTSLWDVDKHYRRKENLVFPYLEKQGITGPPTVMWGKHDQIRDLLKGARDALLVAKGIGATEAAALIDLVFKPASEAVKDMIVKESQILFPLCLDVIEDSEWFEIAQHSPEIGFCLYDPQVEWVPQGAMKLELTGSLQGRVVLPSGSFSLDELASMLNTLPADLTFVDREDTVRYFSQGKERIFDRNRTILGRKVQFCHPPSSVHVVNRILEDFHSGRQDRAEFWITLSGKFIYISYYAVRDGNGEYLGTVEVSMDLTRLRQLEGERRLLSYETEGESA
jgi:DUF438 domain-containing protein